jgi:DNA-binding GntR family transcriptional regulator
MASPANTNPSVLSRKQLSDQVFDHLRVKIISGKIQNGEWLRQEDIGEELGVSHTPIRQALERLVMDGMAERLPFKGVRVIKPSIDEMAEIYALRMYVEPILVRIAVPNLARNKEKIQLLSGWIEQAKDMVTLDQMADRRLINLNFHSEIVRESKNLSLLWLHNITLNKFPDWILAEGLFKDGEQVRSHFNAEITEHSEILEAISRGDSDLAVRFTEDHLLQTFRRDLVTQAGIPLELLLEKQKDLLILNNGRLPSNLENLERSDQN